jgi:hypothetical protein
MNNNGLGSDIHQWAVSLCHALELDVTLLTANAGETFTHWIPRVPYLPNRFPGRWIWEDKALCTKEQRDTPLACYFEMGGSCPAARHPCRAAGQTPCSIQAADPNSGAYLKRPVEQLCALGPAWNTAVVEFLFSHLSADLVRAATAMIPRVFGAEGLPDRATLITVHIRWGDKGIEMDLLTITDYVSATQHLIETHAITNPTVYVSTEDGAALREFQAAAPTAWRIVADPMLAQAAKFRPQEGNHAVTAADASQGREGFDALVSVLLAMEANYFILTTGSNWSQLMNEIRLGILDPRCGGCTVMVDLLTQDSMCAEYRAEQAIDEEGLSERRPTDSWLGAKWKVGAQRKFAGKYPPAIERFYAQESLCHVW